MEADAEDVRSRSRQARLILAFPLELVFPMVTSNFPALGRQIQMDMLDMQDMIDRDGKTTGQAKSSGSLSANITPFRAPFLPQLDRLLIIEDLQRGRR